MQGVTIGVVYLSAAQRFTGLDQLIAGKKHAHAHRFKHRQAAKPDRSRQADVLRPQSHPLTQDSAAPLEYRCPGDVCSVRSRALLEAYALLVHFHLFLHDDGIGTCSVAAHR